MIKKDAAVQSFEQVSYKAQVARLRRLARQAITHYKVRVQKLEFINHGENATFKVVATNQEKFLLRIHRRDYHSLPALRQELQWLELLSKAGLNVPRPKRTKQGQSIIAIHDPMVGVRHCDLFQWIDGSFLSKSISEKDMFNIGVLLAKIQKVGRKISDKHRKYWTSEGLVGANPKFGSVDNLPGLKKMEQKKLTTTRKALLVKLRSYEKRFPQKMGMIHADLHFGNLLKTKAGDIAAIDFDDSGYGFYIYDLVIPLVGLEFHLRKHKRFRLYPGLKKALLEGYSTLVELNAEDVLLLQDLIVARQLLMVGWLNSRSDNPKIKGRVAKYARKTIRYINRPNL